MRTRYVVAYDIANPDRLRRVHKTMKGAGEPIQYSVFQCDLSDREKQELLMDLSVKINMRDDQVLFIDLGPAEGRAAPRIESLGRLYVATERKATIL